MLRYALKRVIRGYRLFLALTVGVLVATTFFSSMMIAADVSTSESVKTALAEIKYDARMYANNITWTEDDYDELVSTLTALPEVDGADKYSRLSYVHNKTLGQRFDIMGLQKESKIWNALTHINGSTSLGVNETYVVASSENASALFIGQTLHVPVVATTSTMPFTATTYVNLTVAGFVDIPEWAARLLHPPAYIDLGFIQIEIGDWREYSLLIVDWDLTVTPLLQWYSGVSNATGLLMNEGLLCNLNRALLINPYDIAGSANNVDNAIAKINDRTARFNTKTVNLVGSVLRLLSFTSGFVVIVFISLTVPIIFMSWYSSTMLSDVSYNLRRREFGLLQTKGFGPRSIRSMLRFEGIIVGLLGGFMGLLLGTLLAHQIVGVTLETPFIVLTSNPITAIAVVLFGTFLGWWAVRGPADRASKLEPLDALKQYIYIEEQREYRRLLPTIALVLGTYKIIVWA
ncbi:MAG: FtsX-like permease family protein, partial [Candidatus Thorarchaeota archaeon]|nr:FtsX-like permease family protein [Candidatus Thorarchaeota archaeon]